MSKMKSCISGILKKNKVSNLRNILQDLCISVKNSCTFEQLNNYLKSISNFINFDYG